MRYIDIRLMFPGEAVDEIDSYVRDALENWGGQFHLENPLFPSEDLQVVHTEILGPGATSHIEVDRLAIDYRKIDDDLINPQWLYTMEELATKYERNVKTIRRMLDKAGQPRRNQVQK